VAYNQAHGIVPRTVTKSVDEILRSTSVADAIGSAKGEEVGDLLRDAGDGGAEALVARLEAEMLEAAKRLEFERAASLRDRIEEVRSTLAMATTMGLPGTVRPRTPAEPRRIKRRFGPDR
jgi:excinuclease ABC subunit B